MCIRDRYQRRVRAQPHTIYKKCIDHLQGRANFRSVIANSIVASGEGGSGFNVPEELRRRIPHGTLYLWPLMCMHWAFSITAVYNRSLLAPLLVESQTIDEMYTVCLLYTSPSPRDS
eukprot:TRINITY_DN26192_c0_g1_i2.p1 TRINITY_DN26192_c0_g1~~TRINITY_DN26192_c0_g1_i2.p1  ORF type:complete len:117 (+),score=19.49 TRINITY_DN26192_c0_g1_i2:147-497(+)